MLHKFIRFPKSLELSCFDLNMKFIYIIYYIKIGTTQFKGPQIISGAQKIFFVWKSYEFMKHFLLIIKQVI